MMIISKKWWISLGAGVLLGFSQAKAALSYSLSSPSVRAGERATLVIRLPETDLTRESGGDPEEAPNAQDDLLMRAPGLLVLDHDFKREEGVYIWRYDLTGYLPGNMTVPPVEIKWGPLNFSSVSLPLAITSERGESDNQLREGFGPSSYPLPWFRILTGLFCLSLAVAAWFWYRTKANATTLETIASSAVPIETDLEWLRRRFSEIRVQLSTDPGNAVIDEITQTLRGYFARTTSLPVNAWTTREFDYFFREQKEASLLVPILERCDRYKFAPSPPPNSQAIAEACLHESERILCG